jgi:Adenylate sensor of SNF1-like protein kinase
LAEPRETPAKNAYYLIAETEAIHHSTEQAQERGLTRNDSFLSSSPPPWNPSEQRPRATPRIPPMSALGSLQMTPATAGAHSGDVVPPSPSGTTQRSKISLLTSSYPLVHARTYGQQRGPEDNDERKVRGINLEQPLPGTKVISVAVKRKPQRYHFGIRSRGQIPLEVMAEIYKALGKLGAEWTEKHPSPDAEDKSLPTDPFTIKCRWRKMYPRKSVQRSGEQGTDEMYVHMEIQLYQQDQKDYLVDFKWGGYELLTTSVLVKPPGDEGVHSAFPFLDIASTLINMLARGGD